MRGSISARSTKKPLNKNLHKQTVLWTQLFSIFTVIASLIIVSNRFPPQTPGIKYTALTALSVWLTGDIILSVNLPYQNVIHVLLQSLSLSLLLIIFLIFIRQRKPVLFRYPIYMAFIPLLIPAAQFIVMDTQIMREIIFMALQGVSIFVFALLSWAYTNELNHKLYSIAGILLLMWGFSFYWILQTQRMSGSGLINSGSCTLLL